MEKPNELLEARPGPISFYEWQIEALNKRQRNLWRENVARKLRQAYPKETCGMSELDLLEKVKEFKTESIKRGMGTQDAIYNWARLER